VPPRNPSFFVVRVLTTLSIGKTI